MILDRMERTQRRLEIKRLEALKEDFMKDYLVICEKYKARLSPVLGAVGENMIRLSMSLDVYIPQSEMVKAIVDDTIKETPNEKTDG